MNLPFILKDHVKPNCVRISCRYGSYGLARLVPECSARLGTS